MKKRLLKTSASSALIALILLCQVVPASTASAAVSGWQKGVSIVSRWNTDFASASFQESVRNAKAMGATDIALIIPFMQDNYQSSYIYDTSNTPSDQTLGAAIDYIKSQGMKATLKPHLETANSGWRALIKADNRDDWYKNYGAMLNRLATVAQAHHADTIVIGTELINMASPYANPDNTQRWKTMISSVRSKFSGKLTYSANWGRSLNWENEFEQIGFWSDLDYIGISAYFVLNDDWNANSVERFKSDWKAIDERQIGPLAARYGKPVLFTEIGYKSVNGAHTIPFDYNNNSGYNAQEQVNLYQALFEYWNTKSYMQGISIWDWSSDPNYGGEWNQDYTPHNKPAESTIKTWFAGSGSVPNPTPTTTAPTGDWTSSASVSGTPTTGSASTFSVSLKNSGSAQNVIADIEIYDSSNSKVFQKFFEGQNISQTTPNYSVTWTPQNAGSYVMKVAAFSSGWTTNYHWNDSALAFSVANPGQNPPPTSTSTPPTNPPPATYTTDIWWPTDGATIAGTQPLKAMLRETGVDSYKMYWQVDAKPLVEMWNSSVDYPHKEFIVNVGSWTWNSDNRYKLTFVSKDLSGNTIAEKSVYVYVAR